MKLIYRQHAIQRMFERGISTGDVANALASGRVIMDYHDDTPYPSTLWLGYAGGRPLHIVYADNMDDSERIIITVYDPDPAIWTVDFSRRK